MRVKLFLDLGFAKSYINPETNEHIPYLGDKLVVAGTQRYASVSNLLGYEVSRRDDLESLMYMAIWMFKRNASWEEAGKDESRPFQKARLEGILSHLCCSLI